MDCKAMSKENLNIVFMSDDEVMKYLIEVSNERDKR